LEGEELKNQTGDKQVEGCLGRGFVADVNPEGNEGYPGEVVEVAGSWSNESVIREEMILLNSEL